MTETQATELLEHAAAIRGAVEYSLTGSFWMLCWIFAAVTWRNFILAKNQRNILSIGLVLGISSSSFAQNYQMSGIVFESDVVIEYDEEGNAESFKHVWEATIAGAEACSYWIGYQENSPAGEYFWFTDKEGAYQSDSADGSMTEVVVVNGEPITFVFVGQWEVEGGVLTDTAAMYSDDYALPDDEELIPDRRWIMIKFPSSGLNLAVSKAPLDDLKAAPHTDESSEHYGEDPDSNPVDPYDEGSAFYGRETELEGFLPSQEAMPDWDSGGGVDWAVSFPLVDNYSAGVGMSSLFAGLSYFAEGDTALSFTGTQSALGGVWPDSPMGFIRGAFLVGIAIWFTSSVLRTLRQY